MAHYVEPMDIDDLESDFDNKENSLRHNNVIPRTLACTEKGYEELDVSELNMKLRYSVSPTSSLMSKSYTTNCDNRTFDLGNASLNNTIINENSSLTRSLNSAINKNNGALKSIKPLPLQSLSTDQYVDSNGNPSALRSFDCANTPNNNNLTVNILGTNEIDENLSVLSSSSSTAHTPEAITPTKDLKNESDSSIIRGLKSVLNLFRPSQSPIPPAEDANIGTDQDVLSPNNFSLKGEVDNLTKQVYLASTPIAAHKNKDVNSSKRNSPHKDSIVFSDGLEKELQWNNETTIIFSQEKIPIHKLFLQQTKPGASANQGENDRLQEKANTTEYMDISYNDSTLQNKTTDILTDDNPNINESNVATESDSEFVDCETSLSKPETGSEDKNITNDNKFVLQANNFNVVSNEINKNITDKKLNATTESLDTTVSVKSGDISFEVMDSAKEAINVQSSEDIFERLETNVNSNIIVPEATSNTDIITKAPIEVVQTINIESPKLVTHLSDNQSDIRNIEMKENVILENNKLDSQKLVSTNEIHIKNISVLNTSHINDLSTVDISQNVEAVSSSVICVVDDNLNNNIIVSNSVMPNDVPLPADVPLPDDDLDSLVTVTVAPLDVKTDMTNSEFQNPNPETHLDKVLNEIQHENNIINCTPSEVELSSNVAKDIIKTIHDNQLEYNIDTYKDSDVNPNLIEVVKEDIMNKTHNVQPMSVSFVDQATINKIVDTTSATSVEIITDNTNAQDITLGSQVQGEGTEQSISNNINNENKMFKDICCIPEVGDVAVDIMKENIVETVNSDNKNVKPMLSTNDIYISEESIKSDQQEISEIVTSISAQEDNGYMVSEKIETNTTNFTSQGEVIINKVLDKRNSDIITCIESGCKHNETLNVTVIDSNSDLPDKIEIISDEVTIPDNTNVMTTEIVKDTVNEDILNKQTDISPTAELTSNNIAAKDTEITIITTEDKLTDNELNIAHETEIEQESTLPSNNIVAQTDEVALDDTMIVVNEDKAALPVEITADNLNINCQLKSIHKTDTIHSNIINEKVINEKEKQTEDERDPISEEIIISENNSPYVSVIADTEHSTETQPIDKFEEIDNPFATKSDIAKSPPIASKGYNFNFDELDDPFATKSKIRMSPPPTSPNQSLIVDSKMAEKVEMSKKVNNRNRRKSQQERKKPVNVVINNLNSTFGCDKTDPVLEKSIEKIENSNSTQVKDVTENEQGEEFEPMVRDTEKTPVDDTNPSLRVRETEVIKPEYTEAYECEKSISEETYRSQLNAESVDSKNDKDNDERLKCKVKETVTNDNNNTSSSEQSTYYSAATSSSEGLERKNVFNLPEIDDKNFNSFSTKLKIRQSPPSNLEIDDQFLTKSKILSSAESSVISPENDVNSTVIVNTPKEFTEAIFDVNKEDKDVTVREIYPGNDVTIDDPFFEAEALNIDKDSSFVGESTSKVKFNGLPTQEIDENDAAELFIDAQAFEFLMNQNKSNEVVDSGKESLFLKFDPLFAGRVTSDGVVAALSKIQKRQSTTKHSKPSQKDLMTSPIAGSSKMDVTQEMTKNNIFEESNEDLNATVSKPMMIVPPAVNPVITPRNKSTTPSRLNRRSLTFTSPAIAVIDRLLSLSSNDSLMGHDITMTQASREQNEADLALTQLRELLAEKEIHVHELRVESKELKDRLATMESKMRTLEMENEGKLKKINELNEKIVENTKVNRNMAVVVEEYERTIASLIAEADHDKKRNAEERKQLIKERDEQTAHLASMEVSFNDLHSKYEKSKQLILEFKAREDSYNKSLQEFKENLTKMQTNYDLLKQHATSKLNHANQELEKLNRTHEAEVLKLNAMIKRKELHITSLEETLAQKTKANEELTAICDELINKVG